MSLTNTVNNKFSLQRYKEAKKQREVLILCLFAPLPLCSKKFHHQFDHYKRQIFSLDQCLSASHFLSHHPVDQYKTCADQLFLRLVLISRLCPEHTHQVTAFTLSPGLLVKYITLRTVPCPGNRLCTGRLIGHCPSSQVYAKRLRLACPSSGGYTARSTAHCPGSGPYAAPLMRPCPVYTIRNRQKKSVFISVHQWLKGKSKSDSR